MTWETVQEEVSSGGLWGRRKGIKSRGEGEGSSDSTGQPSGAEGKASGTVGGRELGGKEGPLVPS